MYDARDGFEQPAPTSACEHTGIDYGARDPRQEDEELGGIGEADASESEFSDGVAHHVIDEDHVER